MNILTISDVLVPILYTPQITQRFSDVDVVIDCGDLPHDYVEYVACNLNAVLFYVYGNHSHNIILHSTDEKPKIKGGTNLHHRVINHHGLLLAGIEGSGRYREGPYQYSQGEMWFHVFLLIPGLLINRILYGRYLDIFVTHAPPWGIHDQPDLPHQGIKAFRWFIQVFKPRYHIHGHIHVYRPDTITETQVGSTQVLNTFGYRLIKIELKKQLTSLTAN